MLSRRDLIGSAVGAWRHNDLSIFASAIAFQALLALVPAILCALGVVGFLGLSDAWRTDLAPDLRSSVSPAVYKLINDTVSRVLTDKQAWWVTLGAALAIWEVSGAVRASMRALDRVFGLGRRRSFLELLPRSLALAVAVSLLFAGAAVTVRFGPLLLGEVHGAVAVLSFVVRWLIAAVLLAIAVALLVRYGTRTRQPLPWVSMGSLLVIGSWVVMSILFGLYVTQIASYGSVFGHLATVFVLMLYLYASAVAFLVGVQADALIRTEVEGGSSGT